MTKQFDCLFRVMTQGLVHGHRYLLLRDELRILSKRLAFPGVLLFVRNCFEKCTYCFTNVEDDLRNVQKRL